MTTFLIGTACMMIGATFGVIIMALVVGNRRPVYDLEGVLEWIKCTANPHKTAHLIIQRIYGNTHHLHANPAKKVREAA